MLKQNSTREAVGPFEITFNILPKSELLSAFGWPLVVIVCFVHCYYPGAVSVQKFGSLCIHKFLANATFVVRTYLIRIDSLRHHTQIAYLSSAQRLKHTRGCVTCC